MKFQVSTAIIALSAVSVVSAVAVAEPLPLPAPLAQSGDCDVGTLQCCNQVQDSGSLSLSQTLSLLGLGVILGQLVGNLGLGCSPITLGLGGGSCNAHPLCCTNNTFNGLINIGCVDITL